jgi:hypothetical protein
MDGCRNGAVLLMLQCCLNRKQPANPAAGAAHAAVLLKQKQPANPAAGMSKVQASMPTMCGLHTAWE